MTAPNGRPNKMLTVDQVAENLSLSTQTVRRMIERRELHHHRIGRAVRISQEDLRAYINSKRE